MAITKSARSTLLDSYPRHLLCIGLPSLDAAVRAIVKYNPSCDVQGYGRYDPRQLAYYIKLHHAAGSEESEQKAREKEILAPFFSHLWYGFDYVHVNGNTDPTLLIKLKASVRANQTNLD